MRTRYFGRSGAQRSREEVPIVPCKASLTQSTTLLHPILGVVSEVRFPLIHFRTITSGKCDPCSIYSSKPVSWPTDAAEPHENAIET